MVDAFVSCCIHRRRDPTKVAQLFVFTGRFHPERRQNETAPVKVSGCV